MKSQKGITLTSLTVYIIVMTIVISVVAFISTYFYKNVDSLSNDINPLTEYTKFNSFFSDEVNHNNIKILECKENYVAFDNGVQYMFVLENKAIYRNQIKIAEDIEMCKFEYTIKNAKDVITVTMKLGNDTKTVDYTLKK